MNGDKFDIVYNTEKPKICDSCKAFLNSKSLPEKYVYNLERELKKIKKPLVLRVELFIKKYPLASILMTVLLTKIISMILSFGWDKLVLLKDYLVNLSNNAG